MALELEAVLSKRYCGSTAAAEEEIVRSRIADAVPITTTTTAVGAAAAVTSEVGFIFIERAGTRTAVQYRLSQFLSRAEEELWNVQC